MANTSNSQRYLSWLPHKGNVLFTLFALGAMLWLQTAGTLAGFAPALTSSATSNNIINYQGYLADSDGNPVNGNIDMIFRIYNTATGGTPLWEETWSGNNTVAVANGVFSISLGSINTTLVPIVQRQSNLYLGVTTGSSEITPRSQLGAAPYVINRTEWLTPPYPDWETGVFWNPTQNQTWDISNILSVAGVPDDAETIFLGWQPSLLSNISRFDLLDANDQPLGTVHYGTVLDGYAYTPVGLDYGSMVAIPGATRKIQYVNAGSYTQEPTLEGSLRGVIVYGWE